MVQRFKLSDIEKNPKLIYRMIRELKSGKIFIYPTDTLYGIGCNALLGECVEKIKKIKERDKDKPLSIIVPSFSWMREHLELSGEDNTTIDRYLPGPYTLLLKKKEANFLSFVSCNDKIGVRIPKAGFTGLIAEAGIPFITTSVNLSGEPFALKLDEIKQEILDSVDFIIETDEKLLSVPSTLIVDGKELKR